MMPGTHCSHPGAFRSSGCRATLVAIAVGSLLVGQVGGSSASADDHVGVPGSDVKYAVAIENTIGDKQVKLVLTGAALRKKATFKVYAIGSYVEQGVAIKDASELAQKDCAKQLHLVMERGVDGKTMAQAFIDGIHLNYAEKQFSEQKKSLQEFISTKDLETGDEVWLTHVPGVGLHCKLAENDEVFVRDAAFSVAVWEIYLGKQHISDEVKTGLTSRLPLGAIKSRTQGEEQ